MPEKNALYAYDFDGLSQVFLASGFRIRQTRYGEGVSFCSTEELNKQICVAIALRRGRLRGSEFRFVRRALELTQAALATMFGRTELTVANWEKANKVPLEASLLLKQNCLRRLGFNSYIEKILNQQGCKEFSDDKIVMEYDAKTERWASNLHPAVTVHPNSVTKTKTDFGFADADRLKQNKLSHPDTLTDVSQYLRHCITGSVTDESHLVEILVSNECVVVGKGSRKLLGHLKHNEPTRTLVGFAEIKNQLRESESKCFEESYDEFLDKFSRYGPAYEKTAHLIGNERSRKGRS
jgi:DNA-binding transcriptional regulator YiaG